MSVFALNAALKRPNPMPQVFVSLGSNINRQNNIAGGLNALRQLFGTLQVSSVYEASAVGFSGDDFYNLVVSFSSNDDAHSIAQHLRQIEFDFGRPANSQKFSARTLDLDLLLYGSEVIHYELLQIPRVDIERYAFVLEPLAELAPALKHPVLDKTYAELWENMPKLGIRQKRIVFDDTL